MRPHEFTGRSHKQKNKQVSCLCVIFSNLIYSSRLKTIVNDDDADNNEQSVESILSRV